MNPVGRKRSFYFPDWMTREVEAEAARLDRSVSWILQRAWKLARADLGRGPTRRPVPSAEQSNNGSEARRLAAPQVDKDETISSAG